MFLPEANTISFYKSINKNVWLNTNVFKEILTQSNLLLNFSEKEKTLLLEFDLISIFLVDTNLKDISLINFKVAVLENFLSVVKLLDYQYTTLNADELNTELGIINIHRTLLGIDRFDSSQPAGLSEILQAKLSTEDAKALFENLADYLFVYHNLDKFIDTLEQLIVIVKNKLDYNFINKYYYLWLFNKAYTNAPKEVFAYVDDLTIAGSLLPLETTFVQDSLLELDIPNTDYENSQILDMYLSTIINNVPLSRISDITSTLTKLNPSTLESLYNFTQIAKAAGDDSGLEIELFYKGKNHVISSETLNQIEDFDLLPDFIEAVHDIPFQYENLEELILFIYDLINTIQTTVPELEEQDIEFETVKEILANVFIEICLVFEKHDINIFEKLDNFSIFEFIYQLDDLFVLTYLAFSGDFTVMITNNAFNCDLISSGLVNYRTNKKNALLKFEQNPEYVKFVIAKRKDFYLSITNHKRELIYAYESLVSFINKLVFYANKVGITVDENSLSESEIKNTFEQIAQQAFMLVSKYGNGPDEENKFEQVMTLYSLLNKAGLVIQIDKDNQISIQINEADYKNFLRGYNNTSVIDGVYSLENLLAFGMQHF